MLASFSNRRISVTMFALLLSLPAFADPSAFKIVALGDSITKAFNANGGFSDSPDVSWSTGARKVVGFESHLQKIQKLYPQAQVTGLNYAVTGAKVKDLAKQVQKANVAKPDYLTLLIGANDVCNWPADYQESLDQFVETLKANLDSVIATNPNVKVTMSAMPDIYRLWQLSKDDASCQRVWNFIGLCKPLLGRSVTDSDRLAFKGRWDHANAALASVAEQYPQHIKFSARAETIEFTNEDISRTDCFHPSIKGQNTLSKETWEEGWFAQPEYMTLSSTR